MTITELLICTLSFYGNFSFSSRISLFMQLKGYL